MCITASALGRRRAPCLRNVRLQPCGECAATSRGGRAVYLRGQAYLGELAERRDVIALAFHVDYWDDLGWRDRFGLTEAVQRQSMYAKTLRRSSAYTPQVVIDGQADYVGSDRASIGRSLAAHRDGVAIALSVRDGQVLIDLAAQTNVAASDIVLVAYRRQAVSAIGRGENAGRTLTEFNIVRVIRTLGQWDGRAQQFQTGVDSFPADATDVAALVQPVGQAPIIGAVAHTTLAAR